MIDKSQINNVQPEQQPVSDMQPIVPTLSPAIGNTIVNGSASGGFIKDATDKLIASIPEPTYYTPKAVIDFINCQTIIGNPPYDTTL